MPLVSGIDTQYIDDTVRAQDDFYRHVNGKWLASVEIPADRGRYDAIAQVTNAVQSQLQEIVAGLAKDADAAHPDERKIADLYASFMDEAALDRLGLKSLHAEFARIDALKDKGQIPSLIAHFNRIGVAAPFAPQVHQDAKDATRYVFDLEQDGLGLPDRDYYLAKDAKLIQVRALYGQHVRKMLMLAGDQSAEQDAKHTVALESTLAEAQWSEVENRNAAKTYNKMEISKLPGLAAGYDWTAYLADSRVTGKSDYLIISQPGYITGFSKILQRTPLPAGLHFVLGRHEGKLIECLLPGPKAGARRQYIAPVLRLTLVHPQQAVSHGHVVVRCPKIRRAAILTVPGMGELMR